MSKRRPASMRKKARSPQAGQPSTAQLSPQAAQHLPPAPVTLKTLKLLLQKALNQDNLAAAHTLWTEHQNLSGANEDAELKLLVAQLFLRSGRYQETLIETARVLFHVPDNAQAHYYASHAHYALKQLEQALEQIEHALAHAPNDFQYRFHKASILVDLFRHPEAMPIYEQLLQEAPSNSQVLNNAGNLYRDLSDLKRAQALFKKAIPSAQNNALPYSNYLTCLHYDPDASQEQIHNVCLQWEKHFPLSKPATRPCPDNKNPERVLRIGMISDGFNGHPVGRMITKALERLPRHAFELTFYSGSGKSDAINKRFKALGDYQLVAHLNDEELTAKIRNDQIDILIDLAGHNSGSRMRVMAMTPAPIQVKWVGGLINTTGLRAIDYLISDAIETPIGFDHWYTEKLIRMPGDYICYEMPDYTPQVDTLPAQKNGFITLGCFNNPTKVNQVLLEHWASIMHQLPNSHLFLKGHYYTSDELRRRIVEQLQSLGIPSNRIRIEGPSAHRELLACYNDVDIALDPWPYSGGLTTCEAFAMGVPVVTMPGPTFAGRHSATHLVNAGMPELVTHSWEEYRARVLELASDLDSLATIRSHLRTVLLQSPVCDADTFAGHLNDALRAIWQRYCEGKQPEALHFNEQGQVTFADAPLPMTLRHPQAPDNVAGATFKWEFEGKVIAIDHGGQLMQDPKIKQMLDLGTLELIVFDPASNYLKHPLRQNKSVHCYSNMALGNGQPATLYACQSAAQSGTLRPDPQTHFCKQLQQELTVLAELPIGTVSLDKVSELPSLDWLVLDELNDATSILENGEASLENTLIIQAKVAFQPTHAHQPNLAEVSHWAARNGFRFYSLINYMNQINTEIKELNKQSETRELMSANAVFIPNEKRLSTLAPNLKVKLAFLLSTAYGAHDFSFSILQSQSPEAAKAFLAAKGITQKQALPYISSSNNCNRELVVGVPIYNEEAYIQETIESLRQQDIDNVLFYVSDNASTDKTMDIVQDIVNGDERFCLHQHDKNIGALNNFEHSLKTTESRFYMWLGGHDYISKSLLRNALDILKDDDSISMVSGKPMAVMDGKVLGHVTAAKYQFDNKFPFNRYLKSVAELANCTIFHSMFRRDNLNGYEFRHTLSHDHVLISRLLAFGKLHYLDADYYFRRYFSERGTTQEERMLGETKKMDRKEFYEHYVSDFRKVFQGHNEALMQTENIRQVLIKRFEGQA